MNSLELDRWLPLYRDICSEFGFSEAADAEAAEMLSAMIADRSKTSLDMLRASEVPRTIVLCGGGDSLENDIEHISGDDYVVAADGAASALMNHRLVPEVIVTDLDGTVKDQVDANTEGCVVFVHAHGDNVPALERWVDEFRGRLIGTCQGYPVEGVFDFGGFTDGDRAACIMTELGVVRIRLAGFAFERPSDKSGRPFETKLRKLAWARRILDMLADDGVEFVPVSFA